MDLRTMHPLDADEVRILAYNLLLTQALMIAAGIAGTIVVVGVTSGDWAGATIGLGWAAEIGASLTAIPPAAALGIGILAALALLGIGHAAERRALATKEGRASVMASRQGIDGELPRLPLPALIALVALIGFGEELAFRFMLLGGVACVLGLALSPLISGVIALVVSSAAFWLAHVRYRDRMTTALTLVLAATLGAVFLATGSLLAVAVAHAVYDCLELIGSRRAMRRDPDYFGGPAPRHVMLDELEARVHEAPPRGEEP